MTNISNKIYYTIKDFKKTAYHHYGDNASSLFKMIYYSMFHVNTFVLVERVLDGSIKSPEIPPEFNVIKPTIEELEKIRQGRDLPREFYYDRFHGIKNCYVAMCGEKPAYIHWIYVKGDYNRFLKLGDGVAELNYNTTLPEFRGKRLMANMMLYIMNDLKISGFKKVVGVVQALNPPALKSVFSAGFNEVRKIKTLGYINRKIIVT